MEQFIDILLVSVAAFVLVSIGFGIARFTAKPPECEAYGYIYKHQKGKFAGRHSFKIQLSKDVSLAISSDLYPERIDAIDALDQINPHMSIK